MTKQEHNGWYNFETWLVNLWMSNEQGSSSYWDERAQSTWEEAELDEVLTRKERATADLADELKNRFEDESHTFLKSANVQSSLWADMLGAALSEVNWREIAEHLIDNAKEA